MKKRMQRFLFASFSNRQFITGRKMQSITEQSYDALKIKMKEIQDAIEVARKQEFESVLLSIRRAVFDYGITERDIFGRRKLDGGRDNRFGRVSAKYRNPETGETWTGRGRPPRWIAGKIHEQFLIKVRA
jgi:DNA-binding protein H-NS